jgi:FkbM family methyltransferase
MNAIELLRHYRYPSKTMGIGNAVRCFRAQITGDNSLQMLQSPFGAVRVRPGSTDILMARDVLWSEEYAFRFRKTPTTTVDAGANISSASIFFRHRFPDATILSIEPDPGNFNVLMENTASLNIQPLSQALWPTKTILNLDFSIAAQCAIRTKTSPDEDLLNGRVQQKHQVTTITPQELVNRLGTIDIFKIDIEGAEFYLFSPDADLRWLDHVNVLIIELHDRYQEGCSRRFWNSVASFNCEAVRGENFCVAREGWLVEA